MNVCARFLELMFIGDAGARAAAMDLAYEHALQVEFITNDEAEYLRVQAAVIPGEVPIIDRVPLKPRVVLCGGLRAIEPSEGGDFRNWIVARIARLWRGRRGQLFLYVTKRGWTTRKKQRWETRDYVDLSIGDSPAHLSGFTPGADGKVKTRGVSSPDVRVGSLSSVGKFINSEFDFNGGTP